MVITGGAIEIATSDCNNIFIPADDAGLCMEIKINLRFQFLGNRWPW